MIGAWLAFWRFCGILDWLCPWCGHLNRHRLNRTAWRIRCKAKPCRRRFTVGVLLQSMAPAQSSGRRTLPPTDVTFPLAELGEWATGGPAHRVELEGIEDSRTWVRFPPPPPFLCINRLGGNDVLVAPLNRFRLLDQDGKI
ncbi:MAG: hypothetical protein V3T83_05240 [Acidobacteriota bacterium]